MLLPLGITEPVDLRLRHYRGGEEWPQNTSQRNLPATVTCDGLGLQIGDNMQVRRC